ncbi:conserved hypothetical protein [Candidatus Desulfarcum epimagneticum]|uniref:DUF86 domain-containing protein n=1 Tax=uncultured Desulfobacteraceae bacterium TaxID=218296 RepID=A0A484HJ50_9BACT|nr:conserved hypothetical protein [uncultured Desulfobacteraceae bacterium]
MIDLKLTERKLRKIEEFLREIEAQKAPGSYEAFSGDVVFKRFVERNIELAIEKMIDVCRHVVSGLDLREPETYAECFEILSESGALAEKEADIFKSMVRYRNMMIHSYDGVDDGVTYGVYQKHLDDFRLFIRAIRNFLASEKAAVGSRA